MKEEEEEMKSGVRRTRKGTCNSQSRLRDFKFHTYEGTLMNDELTLRRGSIYHQGNRKMVLS